MVFAGKAVHVGRLAAMVAAACAGMAVFMPRAMADEESMPGMAAFAGAQPVSDAQMSCMRGGYIGPGGIVNFGVSMISAWATPGGELLTAAATANVDLNHDGRPTLSFVPNLTITKIASGAPAQAASGTLLATGSGILNVTGVGQSIQVAGSSDSISNDAAISIGTKSSSAPQARGSSGPETRSLTSSTGAVVSAGMNAGGMDVSISVPQVGSVLQRLGPGSFVQQAQVAGDLQRVANLTNIQVQLGSLNSLRARSNFNLAVGLLRGLPN